MSEKKEPFFRVDQEQSDSLRLEAQAVSPEEQRKFDEVTRKVCEAFLEVYGKFLTPEQTESFLDIPVLVVENDSFEELNRGWENDYSSKYDPMKLLNGVHYYEYHLNSGLELGDKPILEEPKTVIDGARGRHFLTGRFLAAVPPIENGEIIPVDSKYIMPAREFEDMVVSGNEEFENIHNFGATNNWAQIALHEKIHSILNLKLPLPISEAAASGYQRAIFNNHHWDTFDDGMEEASKYWLDLVAEMGEELNFLAFDNLPLKKQRKIVSRLTGRFTPEQIAKIFPNIAWETEKVKRILGRF